MTVVVAGRGNHIPDSVSAGVVNHGLLLLRRYHEASRKEDSETLAEYFIFLNNHPGITAFQVQSFRPGAGPGGRRHPPMTGGGLGLEKEEEVLIETSGVIESYGDQTFITMPFSTILRMTPVIACLAGNAFAQLWTDPKDAGLPRDFQVQGEYAGQGMGAQVIALGKGQFQAVLYPGGLPGAGWDGKNKILLDGKLDAGKAVFVPAGGKRNYMAGRAAEFSATRTFPPKGHKPYKGVISKGVFAGTSDKGADFSLQRTIRKANSLGAKPPQGAIALFDGSKESMKNWAGGRLDEKTGLINTDGRDIRTRKKFLNYIMHLEFMLPFKPDARSQGRGNSGFYQVDLYEMQILDSFGLMGLNNECGGIYQKADSKVNMCLPPLQWQAYDVDFNSAVMKDGKKTRNAILTAQLNGVTIHEKLEINGRTGGSRGEPEGTPGVIKLQGHGNPLQFRNVWILPKE